MAGISFSGFNGIDFGQIVTALMQSERRPLDEIQRQEKGIKDKNSALGTLATHIGKLQTHSTTLRSETLFSNVAAESADTTIATVSVGTGAIVGQYALNVTNLAKSQVTASTNGYSATDDVAADGGSISFTVDGVTTTPITISASTTLAELKELINNQESGVVASIVNDGTNYKLVITSRDTGADNAFTINNTLSNSGGGAPTFGANSQAAQDAVLTVNGISISSASNTVTDAVPGVTVDLLEAGTVTIDVTRDYANLKETVKTFVADYNKLREFVSQQSKGGPLASDSVLRQAFSDIRSTLTSANGNGGLYSYLSEIGIEFTTTGELKLDEAALNTAIDSHPTDLKKLLQGTDSVNGIFDDLKDRLDALDGTAGIIKTARDTYDSTLRNYRDRIQAQEVQLELKRQELVRLYSAADQAMSRLNAMSGQLQSFNLGSRIF